MASTVTAPLISHKITSALDGVLDLSVVTSDGRVSRQHSRPGGHVFLVSVIYEEGDTDEVRVCASRFVAQTGTGSHTPHLDVELFYDEDGGFLRAWGEYDDEMSEDDALERLRAHLRDAAYPGSRRV